VSREARARLDAIDAPQRRLDPAVLLAVAALEVGLDRGVGQSRAGEVAVLPPGDQRGDVVVEHRDPLPGRRSALGQLRNWKASLLS